ncbi:hypothetical protein DVA67_030740 [Solirubrobacter sp. CPCC 204708]|uniref:DUF4440 domain-containing protein n=1 Tax=Solirubrobacter deserti TaxID=2282478 RepID=A0ABT4RLI4_9ACTN|nr:hypothetical protein [Solirubrobacter deserti]MBE2320381.1 hypothetical protein [Solirubrobacter deserti]MDA0139424.1 hypothetical protein [Solirubrobacter deserti]
MDRRLRIPLLVGCLAVGVAATNATQPVELPKPAPAANATPGPPPADRQAARVATAYALTATNWTSRTRLTAWRRELALAAPDYRRQLRRTRPTRSWLRALRIERASSRSTVVAVEQVAAVRGSRARVLVTLRERTATSRGTLVGETRNQVLLQRSHGEWQVTRWTVFATEEPR